MTTDSEKRKLLRELDAVELAYDVVIPPAAQRALVRGYLITAAQRNVARYLEKRQLAILLALANSEHAIYDVLRTGRQLGYSEAAIRKAS